MPTIPPGLYKWPLSSRVYDAKELRVVKVNGAWHVVPRGAWKR